MRKIAFVLLTIFALLIAGCASNTPAPSAPAAAAPSAPAATASQTAQKIAAIEKKSDDCRIADAATTELKKIMENKNEVTRLAIGVNSYLDVKVGECVIFPIGIRNEMLDRVNFFLDVSFVGAKDRAPIANIMSADKDVMLKWVSMDELAPRGIGPHEYVIIPVKVRVGEMRSADEKTAPGTYRFAVQSYYQVGEISKKDYEPKKEIFVRVLE